MIDSKDSTESTLRDILWKALALYSTEELLFLLEDKETIVRTSAAKQLQRRPFDAVFFRAVSLCNSRKKATREIGAFILGQLGSPDLPYKEKSLPILIKLLDDKSNEVRSTALAAIGHLGVGDILDTAIFNKIVSLHEDVYANVRLSCAFALGSFNKNSGALEVLKKMLLDSNSDVAEWAEIGIEIIKERDSA